VAQTIADIGKMGNGMGTAEARRATEGVEIATMRGDLAKGGGEILLRTPPHYVVPNHSHTSDELYVRLKGSFTCISANGLARRWALRLTLACRVRHRTLSNAVMAVRACFTCATLAVRPACTFNSGRNK
jgi:hypothetical protein